MVTDTDPTRYEKSEVVAPQLPTTHGAAELDASGVHEMDAGSGTWIGERRASPRLYDPMNEYGT